MLDLQGPAAAAYVARSRPSMLCWMWPEVLKPASYAIVHLLFSNTEAEQAHQALLVACLPAQTLLSLCMALFCRCIPPPCLPALKHTCMLSARAESIYTCSQGCLGGWCTATNVCVCNPGWMGAACNGEFCLVCAKLLIVWFIWSFRSRFGGL